MKVFKVIFVLCSLLCCTFVYSQTAMKRPVVFMQKGKSYLWEDVAKERNWGELSNQNWRVFADRDGVEIYETPNFSEKKSNTLKFLEPVFISKISGDFALVYKNVDKQDPSRLTNLIGWVELDKLLLWETCPMTESLTYRKAIILTNLSREKDKTKAKVMEDVHLYNSPSSKIPNDSQIKELEFFFEYKTLSNGYALLLKTEKVENCGQDSRGWTNKYTSWNNRLCFEPNWGMDGYVVVFDKKHPDQARKFMRDGKFNPDDTIHYNYVWHERISSERWEPNATRLPRLRNDTAKYFSVEQVGTISRLGKGKSNTKAQSLKKDREERIKEINIVIVMDGTKSMREYYAPMCVAIQTAMQNIKDRHINQNLVKFGAVIYQNEKDGMPKHKNFTSAEKVIDFFNKHECGSVSSDPYEAMYAGLFFAVDKLEWDKQASNFIILVGDAGSKKDNALNLDEKKIGKYLASKNINFVAFQANHSNGAAYDDFFKQVKNIMYAEAGYIYQREMTAKDFISSNNQNLLKFQAKKEEEEAYPMIISFLDAQIGQSGKAKYLTDLIVKNIDNFVELQDKRRINWNNINETITRGTINIKVLQDIQDLSDEDIELLIEQGKVFNTEGYTSTYAKGNPILLPCVFLPSDEYEQIIKKLSSISNISSNKRLSLQKALIELASAYLGEINMKIDIGDLLQKVFDINDIVDLNLPRGATLETLTEPSLVSSTVIDGIIETAQKDLIHLQENGKKCIFKQNGSYYYYILVSDMPFQQH